MKGDKLLLFDNVVEEIFEKQLDVSRAKEKLTQILEDYSINIVNVNPKRYDLSLAIEKFLNEKRLRGLTDISIKNYSVKLKLFSHFIGENRNVSEITKDEIIDFLNLREESHNNSKITLEGNRSILNVFFDWLTGENLISNNPVLKIEPFIFSEKNIETLNNEEVKVVRKSCESLRERALVEFFLSTGCKLSEVSNLNLENINWELNAVQVSGLGRRKRKVLLTKDANDHLKEYLNSRKDDCNAIFVTERKPWRRISTRGIQREVAIIASRSNINKKISPQTFRYTFAKRMRDVGCPLDVLQSLLGHEEYSNTSETFIRITDENINELFYKYGNLE